MKKLILTVYLALFMATSSWATTITYSGSIDGGTNGGLFATHSWNTSATSLSWDVFYDPATLFWTYEYTWETDGRNLSHSIFQVSDSFESTNVIEGTTEPYALDDYSGVNPSNPGMPASIKGLKFNTEDIFDDEYDIYKFTIVTDKAPMWGDFYGKDGDFRINGVKHDVYAYNTGFLATTLAAIDNGNAGFYDQSGKYLAWVLVPDTGTIPPFGVVPEPSTLVLLGSGLIGLFYMARRKNKTN